jgi:crotonobetainyl-CoA:carnitine CoA-transferase CaiB-like acyl-CoA transferase
MCEILRRFFSRHTKAELYKRAMAERMMITPLLTPREQLELPQLVERNFWTEVEHPELGEKITYPGAYIKPGRGTCGVRFRAPLIGEHNDEIYRQELGLSTAELIALKERRVI